jgi:hypothetical protein
MTLQVILARYFILSCRSIAFVLWNQQAKDFCMWQMRHCTATPIYWKHHVFIAYFASTRELLGEPNPWEILSYLVQNPLSYFHLLCFVLCISLPNNIPCSIPVSRTSSVKIMLVPCGFDINIGILWGKSYNWLVRLQLYDWGAILELIKKKTPLTPPKISFGVVKKNEVNFPLLLQQYL